MREALGQLGHQGVLSENGSHGNIADGQGLAPEVGAGLQQAVEVGQLLRKLLRGRGLRRGEVRFLTLEAREHDGAEDAATHYPGKVRILKLLKPKGAAQGVGVL